MKKIGFWGNLVRPFWALAPMEDVTDTVFRKMVISLGRPDVMFTEFTNVNGICSNGQEKVADRLRFDGSERPIVAQIWGVDPEVFFKAAEHIKSLGFDGIDINLGCPVKEVIKNGACSAMIGKNQQVKEIIEATVEGGGGLPVSVKTRIGFKKVMTEEWIGFLLEQRLAAITIHARTAAEKSLVPARWEEVGKAVELRNKMETGTLIIGNGDVRDLDDARERALKYGSDGVMIGRGVLENPWLFGLTTDKSREERVGTYLEHVRLWRKTWGDNNNFGVLKKFAKAYIRDFEGAAELRMKVMEESSAQAVEDRVAKLLV